MTKVLLVYGVFIYLLTLAEVSAVEAPIYFGEPNALLSPEDESKFLRGFALFGKQWSQAEGLGPAYNSDSCVSCHHLPVPGGAASDVRGFVFHSSINFGSDSTAIQRYNIINGVSRENVLPQKSSPRRAPPLFGIGLFQRVPESYLRKQADRESHDGGTHGRLAQLSDGSIGRFGWKAVHSSLSGVVVSAMQDELGMIAGVEPAPSSAAKELPQLLVAFIANLAAPPPKHAGAHSLQAEKIFIDSGCGGCHVPQLPIEPIYGISHIDAYTDLLVHDMGAELSDGVSEGSAVGSEWRTQPLWGAWASGPYLHDGRAQTIQDAILAHGGQADSARTKFMRLNLNDRQLLVEFVRSL